MTATFNANITASQEAQMDRFGLKLAARLSEQELSSDISERLRVARGQAIAQRKRETAVQTEAASSWSVSGGAAALGGGSDNSWMSRILGALPLIAVIVGLIWITQTQNTQRAQDLAQVDVQLLTDDLPPAAHADAGFAQFLKFGLPELRNKVDSSSMGE